MNCRYLIELTRAIKATVSIFDSIGPIKQKKKSRISTFTNRKKTSAHETLDDIFSNEEEKREKKIVDEEEEASENAEKDENEKDRDKVDNLMEGEKGTMSLDDIFQSKEGNFEFNLLNNSLR
jgi:uncharacterized protein YdaU (DUF1376 family)